MKNIPVWIWRKGKIQPHEFVRFQRKFNSREESAAVRISAENDFTAYLDGEEIMRGQFSDYPEEKTYSEVSLDLTEGEHTLEISVYYCGLDFQTCIAGDPGFWAEIKLKDQNIISDEQWLCRQESAWTRDRMDKVTPQMRMVCCYDARLENSAAAWEPAVAAKPRKQPVERPVPLLENGKSVHGRLINHGFFRRNITEGAYAYCCLKDSLFPMQPHLVLNGDVSSSYAQPSPDAPWSLKELPREFDGYFLTFDLGQELVGLEEFDWDLPAGTIVDIAFGEHLADCRVRSEIWDRFFADRYIAKGGRQRYTMPFRIGARYLELHIIPADRGIIIHEASLRPRRAVLPAPAMFSCDDDNLMAMCRNSIRTLELCMHEHYEDCPWREQALYAYDSRNQILYGHYIWNNYRFAAASLELLGKGLREDGLIPLCAPSQIGKPIPIFSFAWIIEVCEHLLFSGDRTLMDRMEQVCRKIIDKVMSRCDAETGIYLHPEGKSIWHFYEWREGLNEKKPDGPDTDALYNLYFLEVLDAFSKAVGDTGLQARADSLRSAIFRKWYDPVRGCMMTFEGSDQTHEITQVLALYTHCIPESEEEHVVNGILNRKHIRISYSSSRYYYASLLKYGKKVREFLSGELWNCYGKMVQGASTSMWETDLGEEDFMKAGSLCHGWSALPIWFFYAAKLGIRPLKNGWESFEIAPMEFSGNMIFGEVPTPAGNIFIRIERKEKGLELVCTGPESLTPEFRPRAPEEYISASWNGKTLL